jgi:menaquinone-specific isochorismate synthase
VTSATTRIRAGELQKVVLAHDLEATTARPVDERFLLGRLAAAYPDCWTFAVEGLIGASPELLIRRSGRAIFSRVLAGTAWKEHSGDAVSADLLGSAKDIAEHAYAVQSVADVLARACDDLDVPATPVPLELANLTHLSTDITGRLDDRAPTARQVIRELEPMHRGRYAAPVGWMDSRGDGEFAIALRCAQVTGRSVRLMAGCGIVADSDPEIEAREAQIKMIPIRDALESRA